MRKEINKFILKTISLSTIIVLVFNIGNNFINADSSDKNNIIHNIENYVQQTKNTKTLGRTGVALSTNIGIRYSKTKKIGSNIYQDIFPISDGINRNGNSDDLISKNMILIQEYRNILKTNVKELINTNYDKSKILEAFIEQLKFRYTNSIKNVNNLNTQKEKLLSNMDSINKKINDLKIKIENDFKKFDSKASLINIEKYSELKKEYYYNRTYVIYITKFINQYNYLSEYNKKLLDTLILNKDAIIKDAYIVLPDTGTKLLENFDLIMTEKEYKNN